MFFGWPIRGHNWILTVTIFCKNGEMESLYKVLSVVMIKRWLCIIEQYSSKLTQVQSFVMFYHL